MALATRDIPVTREMFYQWLSTYEGQWYPPDDGLRAYLQSMVDELDIPDQQVDIGARDDIDGPTISLVDYLLLDVDSYA